MIPVKDLIPEYLRHMQARGYAERTITGAGYELAAFVRFLEAEGRGVLDDLSADVLRAYQEELTFRLTAKGNPLAVSSRTQQLVVVRGFTRFLKDKGWLVHDPGRAIRLPKRPARLPRAILSEEEVRRLLRTPDIRSTRGYRDRLLLEVLYDTAVRRLEITGLRIQDMDLNAGYVHIRGKGGKDRVAPMSERVCEMTRAYLLHVRPAFVRDPDPGTLFLNRWGGKMHGNAVWAVVKRYAKLCGIESRVSPHTLRHACATHMLKNGAPVRHIQEMLGHASLESTQVYTHVTINDLKKIHARYHPGETIPR